MQAIGKLIKHATTQRGIKKLRKLGEIFQSNNQPPRLVNFNLDGEGEERVLWDEVYPPHPIHMLKLQNMTVFGDRSFTEVIALK